jgi:hypothetical protein
MTFSMSNRTTRPTFTNGITPLDCHSRTVRSQTFSVLARSSGRKRRDSIRLPAEIVSWFMPFGACQLLDRIGYIRHATFVTIQELADQSGYHRVSLARLIRAGKVPGVTRKPSGRTKIEDCHELAIWIAFARHKNNHRFRNVQSYRDIAERREKKAPPSCKPGRFVTAPEAARRLGLSVVHVRRVLENHCRPEARGKRLFYPVTPQVEKWLTGRRKATYLSRSEDIFKLKEKFQRSISRVAGALMVECMDLDAQDLRDARWSIVTLLERSREMIDDLITVAKSSEFQNPEKAFAALNALSDVRQKSRAKDGAKMLAAIFKWQYSGSGKNI